MCVELDPKNCHRSWISSDLEARGFKVLHLRAPRKTRDIATLAISRPGLLPYGLRALIREAMIYDPIDATDYRAGRIQSTNHRRIHRSRKAGSLGKQEKEDSSNAWEAGEYYLGQYDDFSNSKPPEKKIKIPKGLSGEQARIMLAAAKSDAIHGIPARFKFASF